MSELLSNCCGAPQGPIGEMIENCAICSQCGEWANFYEYTCSDCGEPCGKTEETFDYAGSHCTHGKGGTHHTGHYVSSCCFAELQDFEEVEEDEQSDNLNRG